MVSIQRNCFKAHIIILCTHVVLLFVALYGYQILQIPFSIHRGTYFVNINVIYFRLIFGLSVTLKPSDSERVQTRITDIHRVHTSCQPKTGIMNRYRSFGCGRKYLVQLWPGDARFIYSNSVFLQSSPHACHIHPAYCQRYT